VQTECGGGFEKCYNNATAFSAVAHNFPPVAHVMTGYEVSMAAAPFWRALVLLERGGQIRENAVALLLLCCGSRAPTDNRRHAFMSVTSCSGRNVCHGLWCPVPAVSHT
jgi:hypothetical protein